VRSGARQPRAVASGQDIYAASAPLAVEAVDRILGGRTRTTGVASAGAIFDAPDFLRALSGHISLDSAASEGLPGGRAMNVKPSQAELHKIHIHGCRDIHIHGCRDALRSGRRHRFGSGRQAIFGSSGAASRSASAPR
jgi:hypothetical protein